MRPGLAGDAHMQQRCASAISQLGPDTLTVVTPSELEQNT
jgi:hypothetical protein